MKYLVVCDHRKQIIEQPTGAEVVTVFKCKRCVTFDMKTSLWRYKNVRVYLANKKDIEIVVDMKQATTPNRYKDTLQTDWVGP
jgi:hypothetical protein